MNSKTNDELSELALDLIKFLYKNRPQKGFILESGSIIRDVQIFLKSFKTYLTKPNNIRNHESNILNEDWLKWFEKLQQLKSQCYERNRKF